MIPSPTERFRARIYDRHVPVEGVPILSTNFRLIGYFFNLGVLIEKRPCNLAAFLSPRKQEESNGHARPQKGQEMLVWPENNGYPVPVKIRFVFPENRRNLPLVS
jgi:hypothetical protein